jgi:hypothetical protein
MHYIGMSALDASTFMIHARPYVAASMAIAIAASGLALWLATGRDRRPPLILSAVAFGVAISGMHYTAMAGVTLFPYGSAVSGAPALSSDLLAIVVAIVAFCVSGIFSLLLLPEQTGAWPIVMAGDDAIAVFPGPAAHAPAAAIGKGAEIASAAPDIVDTPPRRYARHLPIERDGATHFVAVDDIVAIHANAHYTFIFDGTDQLFCPLAIGEIEQRLDSSRFARVHRSHIVNLQRIAGYRRSGDNGLVEMDVGPHYTVPVSRSRIGALKSRVAAMTGVDLAAGLRRRHHLAAQ